MPPIVAIENLDLVLPGSSKPALQNINWIIEEGAHCAISGPNGSGKSTLLRLLAGQIWPAGGRILWYGPHGAEASPIYGQAISVLVSPAIQESCQRLAHSSTFLEALLGAFDSSPLSCACGSPREDQLDAAHKVTRALQCDDLLERPLPALSQGQLRILLCARAILRRPRLCLLDEALDGLDERRRVAFFEALAEIAPAATVIAVSHRAGGVPDFCRKRLAMRAGRLLEEALTAPVSHSAPAGGEAVREKIGGPLLRLENVNVFIDRLPVLRNLSWTTRKGEHWRIGGANGSGKSTLLRLLAGEEFAAAGGSVSRWLPSLGREANTLEEIRGGIHLVSDLSQALYGYDLTGMQLLLSGFEQSVGLYREYSPAEEAEARAILTRFFPAEEAAIMAETSIRRLSSGQLRRLFLARALMGRPDILLLDEAATGLDAPSRREWFAMLEKLSCSVQIILVSHHDTDVPSFINREAVMEDGKLRVVK